jgi:hypothetical protein
MFAITDTLELVDGTYRVDLSRTKLVPAMERSAGYWVAHTNIVLPDSSYVGKLIQAVIQDQRVDYVGIWTSSSGRVFVDSTEHFRELDDALRAARHRHQQAIWDCANDCLMEVN